MSAVDASCYALSRETESGAGEMKCRKAYSCGGPNSSQAIVSNIVHDLLDHVFDIIMAKELQQPISKTEQISPVVVGDIIDNILSPPSDVVEINTKYSSDDETGLLDEEIKRIIREMKYVPEQKSIVSTQGVGDQLTNKSELTPNKTLSEPVKRTTLERKNRLTNLVRNSKQMLTKLVTNEKSEEVRLSKSEELNESVIKVTDLEGAEAGGSSNMLDFQVPLEAALQVVDLQLDANREEPIEKDELKEMEYHSNQLQKHDGASPKKKWNFGGKILKYLKKNKEHKNN